MRPGEDASRQADDAGAEGDDSAAEGPEEEEDDGRSSTPPRTDTPGRFFDAVFVGCTRRRVFLSFSGSAS